MIAMTSTRPPQHRQRSISMANTFMRGLNKSLNRLTDAAQRFGDGLTVSRLARPTCNMRFVLPTNSEGFAG
jgi:hypothetical protein